MTNKHAPDLDWSDLLVDRNVLIPLADGVELAADLYRPAEAGPHPTLISFYPYHKDDVIGGACEYARIYFTERGYASLLVDFRGTGGSEGVFTENFDTLREGRDGAEVVEWAAAQEWCDGAVGVYGISYGGIMALSIAAQQPPHLKAIAPMYGPPDVWGDWIAPGGCPNCLGNYARASFMLAMDLAPPMLQDTEGRWLHVWRQRLDRLENGQLHALRWSEHPAYDEYWRQRAVPLERIEVPSFLIGSWRDLFPDAVPRSFERISAPKRLLMGPWLHVPPDFSDYEPIDWLGEVSRWWDRWLRGDQNGIEKEPPVTLFVQGSEEWVREHEWPLARTAVRVLKASAGGVLAATSDAEGEDVYQGDPTVGTAAGLWDPLGTGVGYPLEQSDDDLRSLVYTTDPLSEDTEVTGSPTATVSLTLDQGRELQLVAKLKAVAPNGASVLLSTGWLNAEYRNLRDHAEPLELGTRYELRIPMWAVSYLVPKGHRLRLSIACADFPRIWPTKTNPTIRVFVGDDAATELHLPVVSSGRTGPAAARSIHPGANRTPWLTEATPRWNITRDLIAEAVSVEFGTRATMQLPSGCALRFHHEAVATVARGRPSGANIDAAASMEIQMPAGERVDVQTRGRFTRETILLTGRVTMDGHVLFERRWST